MIQNLTSEEIRAVKFYIGDCAGESHPFWGDPKAYLVLNSLFFDGIRTEQARIAEGKFLNPEIVADRERLKHLLRNLLSAFRKSCNPDWLTVCRVERFQDFQAMQQAGRTISFTSTSQGGFLDAYWDRAGIALLHIEIPPRTPCIDMQEFFGDAYAKPEESEILLPPFLNLHFENISFTDSEKQILDSEQNLPVCVYLLRTGDFAIPENSENPESPKNQEISLNFDISEIYQKLNRQEILTSEEITNYTNWKKRLIREVLCQDC
ncbi:MAG: hypothetical protein K2J71_06890 [Oscillospiraceae bacterium]|nr:hypothetical protein [Oscillospiraceae bacterium]